ncbi:hypothetical protein VTK73DRAFT_2772 [Phialemonium thermophilum]|uniref:DUF7704 domain-containing protein n=1 Tax=Phialemonium thermophilum TaxID=223376 RepID=A0ABR3Y2H5_9PEZI
MASRLPPFPRFIFTVFEPISLLSGFLPAVFLTDWFISEQIPINVPVQSTENSRLVAQQLGNCYGLAFLISMAVLYTSTELPVVRNYLKALWLADIGHILLTYKTLHREGFLSIATWNAMTWGNIGVTLFLCMTRTAYLLGLFGPDSPSASTTPRKHW